jgi:hypothetical protein
MVNGKSKTVVNNGGGNAVYGLGFVGALIYYLQQAETLWMGLIGILKALLWPIFLVYQLLKSLGA